VTHYLAPEQAPEQAPDAVPVGRVGFVVGRTVGNSVVRHRTVRRLRHLVRDRLDRLPAGSLLVVRALPPAAGADSAALGRDLDATLARLGLDHPAGPAGPAGAAGPAGPATVAARP
jgi:ribonuclease P protein component